MAGKNFDFRKHFGQEQGLESEFFKIKILENPDLFANLALDNFFQIFGDGKGKTFEAARFMVPTIPENELERIKKILFVWIYLWGDKKKLKKIHVKRKGRGKEGESLHYVINLEADQLSCVKNSSARLPLIVEQHEQLAQRDCSFLTPTGGVKGVEDNI